MFLRRFYGSLPSWYNLHEVTMYVSGDSFDGYGGLASAWGFGEEVDAQAMIPQKRKSISARKADALLAKSGIGTKKEDSDPEGDVYWTKIGPMVTERPLYGGKQVEKVAPPTPFKESRVRVERDMPVIKFAPVSSALGGFGESKLPSILGTVLVLGLIACLVRGYNPK
jgi:hypothetical protein